MGNDDGSPGAVQAHYDQLLGPIYSWIIGDFDAAFKRSVDLFARLNVRADQAAAAIDLGCGSGCQSVALAEAGFHVIAIDFCDELLVELKQHAGNRSIRPVSDDIMNFGKHVVEAPELIVCMGDTLVHLPDEPTVHELLARIADGLRAGGTFIASLRDYSGPAPIGADRFIPVRSSSERIFTCFLEYEGKTIDVHDILYTREGGEWRLRVSRYKKLCLDYRDLVESLRHQKMQVDEVLDHHGMKVIRARKPI